jgi:hypothetical protein
MDPSANLGSGKSTIAPLIPEVTALLAQRNKAPVGALDGYRQAVSITMTMSFLYDDYRPRFNHRRAGA